MWKHKTVRTLFLRFLLILPTVGAVVTTLVLLNLRASTRVQIDLAVDRAVFTIGGADLTLLLHGVRFQSLTVEKFAPIKFSPEKLEVADPKQYKPAEDRYPESAWTSLRPTPPVMITGEDETLHPAITLESPRSGPSMAGILDRVSVSPGAEVTLEFRSAARTAVLTAKVDRQESSAVLALREPFHLITHYSRVSGTTGVPYREDSLTYRARLPPPTPFMEITGQRRMLVFILTLAPEKTTDLFSTGGIPITAVAFSRQGPRGDPETTLVRDGEITYPDYPNIEKRSFKKSDFVELDRLEKFYIERMALDPAHKGIELHLHGVAGHVRAGSGMFPKDHRLTRFDTIWDNPRLAALFYITIWVFPTTVAGYKLLKEVRG